MKNFLKSTLYVAVFALAGILFQISCSNSDSATASPSSAPIGKLLYFKGLNNAPGYSIYTSNYDGTNETLVNVVLPSNHYISFDALDLTQLRMSPDGQKIFFVAVDATTQFKTLYSCDSNGANLTEVIALADTGDFRFGGAY